MNKTKDEEIVTTASAHTRPAVLIAVDLQNLKAFNTVLGYERGDQLLAQTQQRLAGIGTTWRTGGDEFVTLAGGPLAAVTEHVKAFSWLMNMTVGATEAWTFSFSDGRPPITKPWRSFLVVCTPRCGLAEIASDAAQALALARQRCDALCEPGAAAPPGFAPLAASWSNAIRLPWINEIRLLPPSCPACGYDKPATVAEDLGWSREHCPRCAASYERNNVLCVLGEEIEAGYM